MRLPEPTLELRHAAKPEEPDWQYRSRSQAYESVGISLWSWLVVGGLSVWFCIWLIEGLARVAARVAH